jgi:DNA processing protein
MNVHEYLSDDGHTVLALCSPLGLSKTGDEVSPLTLSDWNELEKKIENSSFKRPSELQGRSAEEISRELLLAPAEAEQIARLLGRMGELSLELETCFSRGMWAITRLDERYPARLRDTLKHQAPSVLFGAGDIRLLQRPGVAVVGSRNIDEKGAAFAREIGAKTVAARLPVVSGGARGTDRLAMDGAIRAEGAAIGALADSLEATIRKPDVQPLLADERLVLVTPYSPAAGFSVGAAMGRNKVIYGLSKFAVVVSSDFKTGGTWAGAVEALKGRWCPVFVRDGQDVPKGNRELIKLRAVALPEMDLEQIGDLAVWMDEHTLVQPEEQDLFR